MSYILRIHINARLMNPSKDSLIKLKDFIMKSNLENVELTYSTVKSVDHKITPILIKSKIMHPVNEKGSFKNVKIIERLLDLPVSTSK